MDEKEISGQKQDVHSRELLEQVPFAITARVALQLGRESISNSITAITELVKNAYDADAENVDILFSGLHTDNPILVIEDDGNGMSVEQVKDTWLVIGTDYKVAALRSGKKKRLLTGEKGLGRLGLDRLCEVTQLQTFTKNDPMGTEIEINWKKYEGTNAKLESIAHAIYQIPKTVLHPVIGKASSKTQGTRLILKGLKDSWTYEDLQNLYNELTLLVSPFAGVDDFSISFYSDVAQSLNGKIVSDNLLHAAEWKVVTTFEIEKNEAFINFVMTSSTSEAKFESSTTWSKAFPEDHDRMPECGPLKFEFYYIPRKDIPALSLKKAQVDKFLDNNQGIRIYRDNFRVMPYGKPSGDGDWLGLSLRRTRSPAPIRGPIGGWKIGYNQIVGAVFISRETNKTLLDQTNREGILEGPAYYDLRRFALFNIELFERQLQRYEKAQRPKAEDSYEKARAAAEETTKASVEVVQQFKETVDTAVELLAQTSQSSPTRETVAKLSEVYSTVTKIVSDQQQKQEQLFQETDKREEERQEEFQRQKDTLGNLASLGILATTFGHETVAASNLVLANSKELRHQIENLFWLTPDIYDPIYDSLGTIEYGASKINTFANFTLKNVRRDKRQRTKIYLDELVKQVFKAFEKALQEREITIFLEFADPIPAITAFNIDWESIFVNFITNAVWALENTRSSERKIRVQIREDEGQLHLCFADSGHGIAIGTEDSIFLPTFSTKRNRKGDVIGTGMGLAIVQSFVESYNGTIYVESPCDLGGAEFHIKIPLLR